MANDLTTLLCTCPDADCAQHIATELLEQRLAACVNLIPGIRSFYRWDGQINEDQEVLLIIKTTAARFAAIEATVSRIHPYDVPELIALPITTGNDAYLDWLRAETQ